MSGRQSKKRKARNHINNRERTVTTFTEDPNTSFLVPLSSEEPPPQFSSSSFSMPYQNYIAPQQQQFFQPILPPGKNDLEILENLKTIIKEGQHEFYRAVPQPAALASLYIGRIPQGQPDQLTHDYPRQDPPPDGTNEPADNTVEPHTPHSAVDTSPSKIGADLSNLTDAASSPVRQESEDISRTITQGPAVNITTDAMGEYGARQPLDTASSSMATPFDAPKDDEPSQLVGENAWERRTLDDRKARFDDRSANLPQSQANNAFDNGPPNGAPTAAADVRSPPAEDRRFYDRERSRDRDRFIDRDRDRDWDRDRDRHDSIRDTRDRDRDRDVRDRRPEFFGRSYGRSHAPRPPPELRHYEPSYGDDYVPPPRRFDPDDRRGGLRNGPFDDRSRPPPFDDRRPPFDDRRPPPPSAAADDRRLPLDDRPIRPLPGSDTRALPPSSEDRARPAVDSMPLARAPAEDDRGTRATSLAADDRPRANVPLEERLSQPAPTPSLQDRLSQPGSAARVDISSAPSLEERLSLGPVPPRAYARDDLRPPLPKDDPRGHDRLPDFRANNNRDFSRERLGGLATASTYRPDLDRSLGDRDDRDRRDRDVADVDTPARFGDAFSRVGPPPARRYSPPPHMLDRDRERERGRAYYPPRSPPPSLPRYDPDGDGRYTADRERDSYEQRRRDWYGPGDDDKRAPPPASWRPERPPFMDRDRFDRERDRDRDVRERDRERERDLGALPPRHWDDRERRAFPVSPPPARMDPPGGRSLSARLTDPYPGNGEDRGYPPAREFERGRYGAVDDHPLPFGRVRGRSPSPPRRAEDMRPPMKRMRDDNGGYLGATYSPPRRGVGEYAPGPPPSSAATTTSVVASVSGTVAPRSTGTRTPPVSAPPPSSGASSAFYERGVPEREREREREYVRDGYGMGYDRERGRRSPPLLGSRMGGPIGGGGGYGRGVVGDRRDDRRYIPPPPRTS